MEKNFKNTGTHLSGAEQRRIGSTVIVCDRVADYPALVIEELNRLGVRMSVISESRGESDPLVATEDGVRQPQNRRASIVLQ